jgi:hypothetical protein
LKRGLRHISESARAGRKRGFRRISDKRMEQGHSAPSSVALAPALGPWAAWGFRKELIFDQIRTKIQILKEEKRVRPRPAIYYAMALGMLVSQTVPSGAWAQYRCGFPPYPPCPQANGNQQPYLPPSQLGVRCYTRFGPCFLGSPMPVGSGCGCPSPYGFAPGTVGG